MSAGDEVYVAEGKTPDDYHCTCEYCKKVIGELVKPDGSYYSRLERREYYDPSESGRGGHIAKTPLHVARWAVQRYSQPGDWVLDPTVGAGTTAVEALTQGRNAIGMELQFGDVLRANLSRHQDHGVEAVVRTGDAREIGSFLDRPVHLVVNNPPYSGDESEVPLEAKNRGAYYYENDLPNLAFLREGQEYWDALRTIYTACADRLVPGGRFVVAVKDMMRQKKPFLLHKDLADLLASIGLEHEGTAFLRHYPGTLFLNTYFKRYAVHPPYYQTIIVFRRPS